MDAATQCDQLRQADVGDVRAGVPLRRFSTYRLGGPADVLVQPASVRQLANLRCWLKTHAAPHVILGDGSNILFDDAGLRGVAVRIGPAMAAVRTDGGCVIAGAGVSMARLARTAARHGLAGIEDLAGVPGRLGGMVVMNGGCFRQKIGDVVCRVTAVDCDGSLQDFDPEQCRFDYRCSVFQDQPGRWAIAEVELQLDISTPAEVAGRMLAILRERRQRFPRYRCEPNCGSVFKNSPEMYERFGPPGKVVEDTGCKGWREGGAEVNRRHANFITARPGTTASDVLRLIARVQQAVRQRTGITMQCEVRYVHADGRVQPADVAATELR